MLFADLSTFFPRIQREGSTIADLSVGLPQEVVDIALAIYGQGSDDPRAVRCRYDSSGGLSDSFVNGVGALMGCPLSTDRARIFLNAVIIAIQVHTHGLRLWGSAGDSDGWRRVSQLVCADDWLGLYESAAELRKAWAIWCLWEPMTGAKVGIKAADKTVLCGVAYDDRGKPRTPRDPMLKTADGRRVPMRGFDYAYSHLGRARCAGASRAAAFKKLKKSFMAAVTRVRRLKRATHHQVMVVSEALIGGCAGFYLQDLFLTWKEADELEAKWRRAYNDAMARARDTPRAQLYAAKHVPGDSRRHLYSHGVTALFNAVNESIADFDDCEHRALARSGLALTFYQWGCRQDPRTWDWSHLRTELEGALKDKDTRLLGDAYMLAALELVEAPVGMDGEEQSRAAAAEHWRWTTELSPDDPLHTHAPHFRPCGSTAVSNLGAGACDRFLLAAGYVATGHFASRTRGSAAWATFDEALQRDPQLQHVPRARERWGAVVAAIAARTAATAVWEGATPACNIFAHDCSVRHLDAPPPSTCIDVSAVHALGAEMLAARRRGVHSYSAADVQRWRDAMDGCMREPPPAHSEWAHGVPDGLGAATAARVVYDIYGEGEEHEEGGGARWLNGAAVGSDGYTLGWEAARDAMQARFDVDGEGYVTEDGARVALNQLHSLPPCIQLIARARHALGKVLLTDTPVCREAKLSSTHVNVTAAARSLAWAIETQCKFLITHAATVDGTKVSKRGPNGSEYTVVARAAVLHDGSVVGGRLVDCEDPYLGEANTTYFAEKVASNEALQALPPGARAAVWLDSTSPVHAMRRFRRVPARRKAKLHASGVHAVTEELMQRLQVVVYHWQMSHTGDPANEWADVLAAAAAADEQPLPARTRGPCTYCSAVAPRTEHGPRAWAALRGDALVHARLLAAVRNTIVPGAQDIRPLGVPKAVEHKLNATRAERRLPTDVGHRRLSAAAVANRRRILLCPHCDAECDWLHISYECQEPRLVAIRHEWADRLERLRLLSEGVCYHAEIRCAEGWACYGVPALRHAAAMFTGGATDARAVSATDRLSLRRAAGAVFRGCPTNRESAEVRHAAGEATRACELLMATGERSCYNAWREELRELHLTEKVFGSYGRKLRERVAQGGPLRRSVLRCLDEGERLLAPSAAIPRWEATRSWWWLARLTWWRWRARRTALGTNTQPQLEKLAHAALLAGLRGHKRARITARRKRRHEHPGGADVGKLLRDAPVGRGVAPVLLDCAARRSRKGSKRRVNEMHNRAVREGRQADHRRGRDGGAWAAERVVNVRRRAGKGFALDALIRWVGDWDDTWEPVNKRGIPCDVLRADAREMWASMSHERGWQMDSDEEEHHLRHAEGWGDTSDSDDPCRPGSVPFRHAVGRRANGGLDGRSTDGDCTGGAQWYSATPLDSLSGGAGGGEPAWPQAGTQSCELDGSDQASSPALDWTRPLRDQATSELSFDYCEDYWRTRIGTHGSTTTLLEVGSVVSSLDQLALSVKNVPCAVAVDGLQNGCGERRRYGDEHLADVHLESEQGDGLPIALV